MMIRTRALAVVCLCFGCTASADSALPPLDRVFDPTGIAVAPDESALFVVSANAELRYNSGTVSVIDLALVDAAIAAWTTAETIPAGCAADPDRRETLQCAVTAFLKTDSAVMIGNFATNIAIQDRGTGRARLVIPTRGDPSVTWVDWDGVRLSCSDAAGVDHCDDAHRLLDVAPEPFDAYADSDGEFAMITDFTTGAVSLLDSPRDGAMTFTDQLAGIFLTNDSGYVGASGIAGRPSAEGTTVYVGSPYEDRIQTFTVGRPVNDAPPYLVAGSWFFLDGLGAETGGSMDTRALAFGEGDQLHVLNRNPPSVQIVDTSETSTGTQGHSLTAATDVCRAGERLVTSDTGDGERIFVTCFQDGQLYVIDPRGGAYVEDVFTVGNGPYALAAAPGRQRLYITNFLAESIAVVDTAVDSATQHRVVLELGAPDS